MSYEETSRTIRENGRNRHGRHGFSKIVFTNGCFDILHPGHLNVLVFSSLVAGHRGCVVVGVNDDESVRRLKGPDRPFFTLDKRVRMLRSLRYVDHVVPFSEETPLQLIEELIPDEIVKGGDYEDQEVVGAHLAKVRFAPYFPGFSTTALIQMIRGADGR